MTPAPKQSDIASESGSAAPRSLGVRLRTWFFTGLVIFGPVAVTVYIAWWFIDTVDNWVKPLVPARYWPDSYLPFHVPGFGVVIALAGLTLLGFLAANIAGRSLLGAGEAMLDRTPVLRSVYKSLKHMYAQVVDDSTGRTLASVTSNTKAFKAGVLDFLARRA